MENKSLSDLHIKCEDNSKDPNNDEIKDISQKQSNINSEDIDKETITKLRGDAIGDTMYSQSSVIKILLQLSEIEWNKKLEEDLCFMWDMTVEKDVCDYLFHLSFPSIATAIILKYSEPRLIEIIIGILGNICSNIDDTPDITDVEISIVLTAMDTDDHLILIQIMRFITTIVYHRKKHLQFITSEIMEKLYFILTNSTNKELLLHTMDTLAKLTTDFKIESELLSSNIINSLLIAYNFINKKETDEDDEFDEETEDERKSLNFFVQIMLNVCSYLNEMSDDTLLEEICIKNKELVLEFRKITKKFCKKETLIPLSEDITFYFDSFTIIFPVLCIEYDKDIFINVINIMDILIKKNIDKINEFIELCRYIISVVNDVDSVVKDIKNTKCNNVLQCVLDNESNCEFKYKEKLLTLIENVNKAAFKT